MEKEAENCFDVDILFVGFLKTDIDWAEHRHVSRCGWLVVEVCNCATKVSEDRNRVLTLIHLIVHLMVYLGAWWDDFGLTLCVVCDVVWFLCMRLCACGYFQRDAERELLTRNHTSLRFAEQGGSVWLVWAASYLAQDDISLAVLILQTFFSNLELIRSK